MKGLVTSKSSFSLWLNVTKEKKFQLVLVYLVFPPLLLYTARQVHTREILRTTRGASSHKTALKHMFSPTRLQVKHVLKAHCFGKDEQFSVAIARDFLERVILHTS